ncbi:MAG: AgmX/PglI C-terminal domain-containing protein [Myxococcaceae bacterium]|nr:AgmX/PglI C-terminal domain-containing protein [Myxococcaceae bacterium]
MSEAELDAVISQLRTDKNLIIPAAPAQRERWGSLTERLLLGTASALSPLELAAAREEAALQAWHIALGDKAAGPVDIAALRAHWEHGELGPDSLCWRKGFEGWQPICRVRGLVELLAPRPDTTPAKPEDLVPNSGTHALDFPLKGAEALRVLSDDLPPPLPRPATLAPFFLEPALATAPELSGEPETQPEAPQALSAAGVHPVLSTGQPAQVEVRVRGGAWLALGGGVAGGLLVACVMWLLGLSGAVGVFPRGASPEAATHAGTTQAASPGALPGATTRAGTTAGAVFSASAASAPASTSTLPAPVAPLPFVTAPAAASVGALPPPGGSPLIATVPSSDFGWGPALGNVSAPMGTASMPLAPRAGPTPTGTQTVELSKRVAAPVRPSPRDPPLLQPAKAEVLPQPTPAAEERVAARVVEEETEEEEDELGLDEDFERELEGAGKQATAPRPRTAWIPPAPAIEETPASLAQSDIFSGVVANKGDVAACVAAQKLQSEEGNRRVVMRWTILPSGKVTEVVTETAELRGTPLALCLEGKIRSWTFPKHREQGGPVRFPFVF